MVEGTNPEEDALGFEITIIATEGEEPKVYYDEDLQQYVEVFDRDQLLERLDKLLPRDRNMGYTILKAWKDEDVGR